MLSTYSFKRTTFLVGTMIFAGLAVAMMAQSVHAENMAGVRRAVVSNGSGSKVFSIDTSGRMRGAGDFILEITRLEDDGSLVGKYSASGKAAPSSTNVTGTITIVGVTNIRISFTAGQTVGQFTSLTVFEGAIRLGGAREPSFGFMAGTFTFTDAGAGAPRGPYPFCAHLTALPG
jgi:hypothetical protein